jgi:aspartate carbamoyltransferase catalytic subunit
MPRSLLTIRALDADTIRELIATAADFKKRLLANQELPKHSDKVVGMLFFENSTRTRVSFEQAAHYLGMKTASFSQGGSSMSKGETLKDTIYTLRYERITGLVMRHQSSGAANLAAKYFGGGPYGRDRRRRRAFQGCPL